ncbi:von_Willebrand factor type A domain-containing protein [Hexamita inflata]|uniref:von Willebrand factor type A domain-containing protein n=1 Tax=Hexamita inflata TaxID=28002 RepID=A0AA86TUH4_9EUKA|nr:von Willebrand factor type A domain-containing protein [Hexamita inflata]
MFKRCTKTATKIDFEGNQQLVDVIAILDQSGSMQSIASDTIGGFNSYLSELQKQDLTINLTLVLFSTDSKIVWENKDVKTCEQLTNEIYRPSGGTALRDALGKAIENAKIRVQNLSTEQKPGKVSFFISTDGEENSSRKYSEQQVKKMVEECTKEYQWEFIFAGANIDAFAAGQSLGFKKENIANIENDGVGQQAVYSVMAQRQSAKRCESEKCESLQAVYSKKSALFRK